MREHGTLHVPDIRAQNDFPLLGSSGRLRTFLAAPLRQQGELVGILIARRTDVRPFTPAQIKLLETFADQAVIAIENVRLFQELKESLEQQTATSEILGVIASSPTDDLNQFSILSRKTRHSSVMRSTRSLAFRTMTTPGLAANYGALPAREGAERPLDRGTIAGRAVIERKETIHVNDL